ncbi:Flavin reductase-like- FMN-binding protein [Apiospora hydei]|uniref:Flavin reductase-like- FMN-binding protein n=1 Tax=Apiospora hydei TaxID=1337664 RepID=A0ABR1UVT5_9PEZI
MVITSQFTTLTSFLADKGGGSKIMMLALDKVHQRETCPRITTASGHGKSTTTTSKKLMRHVPRPVVVVTSVQYPNIYKTYNDMSPEDQRAVIELANEEGMTLDEFIKLQWLLINQYENKSQDGQSPEDSAGCGPTPRAMTVSSFSSVTLDPKPTITFSITKPSRTYDAIASSRRFNIHVLRDDENGARLAHHFTQGNAPAPGVSHSLFSFDKFPGLNVRLAHGREAWEQSWQKMLAGSDAASPVSEDSARGTISGVPCLQGDAVLYVLRCVVAPKPEGANGGGLVDVGGSAIIVGEIEDFIHEGDAPDVAPTAPHDTISLTYVHQEYRKTGKKLEHGAPQKPT